MNLVQSLNVIIMAMSQSGHNKLYLYSRLPWGCSEAVEVKIVVVGVEVKIVVVGVEVKIVVVDVEVISVVVAVEDISVVVAVEDISVVVEPKLSSSQS